MGTEAGYVDDFDDLDADDLDEDEGSIQIEGDEDDITIEDDLEIEVVDDTPPDDVGRLDDPDAVDIDDTDDEATQYSQKVRKRMAKLTAQAHASRRNAEKVQRERDEAVSAIQTLRQNHQKTNDEIKALRTRLHDGEKVYVTEVLGSLEAQLQNAEANYRSAYEEGRTEEFVAATKEMARLTQRIELAKQYRPAPVQEDDAPAPPTAPAAPQQARPAPDPTVSAWMERNPWFSDPDKKPMNSVAMAIHGQLVKQGIHPTLDASKYYKTIDREMRKRFPEYRWPDVERNRPNLTSNPSGGKRTKPKQVRLTTSQVALAKSLGLTNEQYALEVAKLQSRRG